ncbi:MAG TPA: 3-oxoacyl-ACP reductase family protein [Micromonosporaceae bacterium]
MTIDLHGKKALVTGGTRGIGRAISRSLAGAGANLVVCHRQDSEAVAELANELKEFGGDHHVIKADVSVAGEVERLVGECRDRFGSLDIVVHNAGTISHIPIHELDPVEWQRVLDTNLTAAYRLARAALPVLRPGASLVNVGSRAAAAGVPLRAHYTAAKAGLVGLTRSLAKELGPKGIRVNVVAPGPTETEEPVSDEVRQRYQRMIALGRLGRADEVAHAVLFLASDLASFITGETLNVDGGI